jgi:DNA-binding transcriptional LysR family regulator
MSMNFRQLEVFRAVAEANSFTRASHSLFISQSTVSQHIRELEDSLGVKLFLRNRRTVSLAAAGEDLLEHSRNIFRMLDQAELAAKTFKDPYHGKLTFGCASTTLLYQLPPILTEYASKYPNVELNITGGTIQDVAKQMWSGELDFALVVLPLSAPALQKQVLLEESFVGVVPKNHSLASKPHLAITDIAGERFILHRKNQNTRKLVDQYLFKQGISPHVAMELDETETIKAIVARGYGVSVLPESAFIEQRTNTDIRTFRIPRKQLHRSLAVVYSRTRTLRPAVAAFIALLQKSYKEMPALARRGVNASA